MTTSESGQVILCDALVRCATHIPVATILTTHNRSRTRTAENRLRTARSPLRPSCASGSIVLQASHRVCSLLQPASNQSLPTTTLLASTVDPRCYRFTACRYHLDTVAARRSLIQLVPSLSSTPGRPTMTSPDLNSFESEIGRSRKPSQCQGSSTERSVCDGPRPHSFYGRM